MLKKISAALIAVSMLAVPAMAASTRTETAPVTKRVAPTAKLQVKPSVRNAHASMTRHHRHHAHKIGVSKTKVSAARIDKVSAHKTGKVSKATIKGSAVRHG